MGIAGVLFASGVKVFTREVTAVTQQNDLAAAKSVLLDDLSIAGYGVGPTTNPIAVADSTTDNTDSIEILGDTDSTFEEDGIIERICYDVSGGDLRRSLQPSGSACGSGPGGWQVLASDVIEFNLAFFNSARTPSTSDTDVTTAGLQCWPPPPVVGVVPTPVPNTTCYIRVTLTARETIRQQVVQRRLTGEAAIRN